MPIKKQNNHILSLVCSSDNNYVLPLTVMVRSVVENLQSSYGVDLYILDGGISEFNKERIIKSWDFSRINLHWTEITSELLKDIRISGHYPISSYYRILIPEILPDHIKKIIYLDCDIVVCDDISKLWTIQCANNYVMAVQDMALFHFGGSSILKNFQQIKPYLISTQSPIKDLDKLNIPPEAKYFNSGVLVINLQKWRKDKVHKKIISYLKSYPENNFFADQDGLNVVFYKQWGEIDLRWNQLPQIYFYPSWDHSPYDKEIYSNLIKYPRIIHYAEAQKPWNTECIHPERDRFFYYLDMTDWTGWRPQEPWMIKLKRSLKKNLSYKHYDIARQGYRTLRRNMRMIDG